MRAIAARLEEGLHVDLVLGQLRSLLSSFAAAAVPTSQPPWRASYGRYPRILLNDPSDAFQLILVLWPPGGRSAIHDHDESLGGVVALWGELVETKYTARREGDGSVELRASDRRALRRGDFTPILPEDGLQLHDMANEGLEWGATVHVYLRSIADYHSYSPAGPGHREHAHSFWFDYEDGAATWDEWVRDGAGSSEPVPAPVSSTREGSCVCGAVRVRAHGAPALRLACHCSDCRHSTGDPVTAWTFFPTGALELGEGGLRRERYVNDSGYVVRKDSCALCGSLVRFASEHTPQLQGVRTELLGGRADQGSELDLYLSSSVVPRAVPTGDPLGAAKLRPAPELHGRGPARPPVERGSCRP